MMHTKMKIAKNILLLSFKKKSSPENVERTLKSWKRFWNIFLGKGLKKPKNAYGTHKNENFQKHFVAKFSKQKNLHLKMLK
jgi:hypothetical protein